MAAIVARPPQLGQRLNQRAAASASTTTTTTSTTTTTTTTVKVKASKASSSPSANKQLQPLLPSTALAPTPSPSSKPSGGHVSSLLYPPDKYPLLSDSPPVYTLTAAELAAALEHIADQPLPETKEVFPWLHGLHPLNHAQQAFFGARRRSSRKAPKGLRAITIVKAGGDLTSARLRGALAPSELLPQGPNAEPVFLDVDPPDGFSVRNFHIQACKMAAISDIVVYRDSAATEADVLQLARSFVTAQRVRQAQERPAGRGPPIFNTFVLTGRQPFSIARSDPTYAERGLLDPFETIEADHPNLVAIDSAGRLTGRTMDFFQQERMEMCEMSRASEIARNVWLGPTPDDRAGREKSASLEDRQYDVLIEATDLAPLVDPPEANDSSSATAENSVQLKIEFPSSGSILPGDWKDSDTEKLINTCQWLYRLANPEAEEECEGQSADEDGDIEMVDRTPPARRILIHCADGYTETSFLAVAYFMYAEGVPVHEAWLRLHRGKQRNFFAYPSDVSVLLQVQARVLQESRALTVKDAGVTPRWLSLMDGSLPSRILPYLYLGNLGHANNPEMLRALGIGQVLSVGESLQWTRNEWEQWNGQTLLVDRVQDNGIDPLMDDFSRCLAFIEQGKLAGTATLVHCRVGVSRSATICIAEVMKSLGLSFPRAYCFVRARRLNVIIQPHLRFSYELLKWEERRNREANKAFKRELEWATIAREIASMNKPYAR